METTVKQTANGKVIRREWLKGEGKRFTYHVVWKGEEKAGYPHKRAALLDLDAWEKMDDPR